MKTALAIDGGLPVRPKDKFLVFGAPQIDEMEIREVVDSMRSGWIGTGPKVRQFETDFARYKGGKFAIALNSCTAALHLSLLSAGVGPGDEVITTPMTFCATVNSIIHCGAVPVLADVDRDTFNIDPSEIKKRITGRTKAIIPVHFAGRCCEMDEISKIARENNLIVIEDCAHAIETEYYGRKAGCIGDIGCFSFYVTKNVITGEGGMIVTENEGIAEKCKVLSLHGMSKDAWKRFSSDGYRHYEVVQAGFKYNMMDLQASIGLHQLSRVEQNWAIREGIWNIYNKAFADLPCVLPAAISESTRHAYHLYTPLIDVSKIGKNRDWVLNAMTAENIGVGVHYLPVHVHPYYQTKYQWKPGDYPNAEWIGERTLSLPLSAALSDRDVDDVVYAFKKVLA